MEKKTVVAAVGIAVAGVAARSITKHMREKKLALQKSEETRKEPDIPQETFQGIDWSKI